MNPSGTGGTSPGSIPAWGVVEIQRVDRAARGNRPVGRLLAREHDLEVRHLPERPPVPERTIDIEAVRLGQQVGRVGDLDDRIRVGVDHLGKDQDRRRLLGREALLRSDRTTAASIIPTRTSAALPARSPFAVLMGSPPSKGHSLQSPIRAVWPRLRTYGMLMKSASIRSANWLRLYAAPRRRHGRSAVDRPRRAPGRRIAADPRRSGRRYTRDAGLASHRARHSGAEDRTVRLRGVDQRDRGVEQAVDRAAGGEALLELVVDQELGSHLRDELLQEVLMTSSM